MNLGEEIKGLRYARGSDVIAAFGSGRLALWNARRPGVISSFSPPDTELENNGFEGVALSEDGTTLAAATEGRLFIRGVEQSSHDVVIRLPRLTRVPLRVPLEGTPEIELMAWPSEDQGWLSGCSQQQPVWELSANAWRSAGTIGQRCRTATLEEVSFTDSFATDVWRSNFAVSRDGKLVALPFANELAIVDATSGVVKNWLPLGFVPSSATDLAPKSILEPEVVQFSNFTESRALVTITAPMFDLLGLQPSLLQRWERPDRDSTPSASRTLADGRPVSTPGDGQYTYLFNDVSGQLKGFDNVSLINAVNSVETRVVDEVATLRRPDRVVLVVLHEPPRVIDVGYGALDVPYYVEFRSADLSKTYARQTFTVPITSLAISPDGGTVAIGTATGSVRLFSRDSGLLSEWSESNMPIRFLAFTSDPSILAVSTAPSGTAGDLPGTREVGFVVWEPKALIQIACDLLSYDRDRDLSEYRATANGVAFLAGLFINGCPKRKTPSLVERHESTAELPVFWIP